MGAWNDRPQWRFRPLATLMAAASVALLLSAPSCAALDDIARGARPLAEDAGSLGRSKWVPPRFIPKATPPTSDEIVSEAIRLAGPTTDVPAESRKEFVNGVCEAVDYVEAQNGTEQDAYNYLVTRSANSYSHRVQAQELVKNLVEAGSSFEQAVVLGRAALCEWAAS